MVVSGCPRRGTGVAEMVQWAQEEDHGHSTSWSDAWPWEQQLVHRARRTYDEMGRELLNTHRECALREPEELAV